MIALIWSLVLLLPACAHSKEAMPLVEASAPAPAGESTRIPPAPRSAHTSFQPKLRVPLPYRFSRRGVGIRVNSVERVAEKLHVSVTLEETRHEKTDINTATLMEPQLMSGGVLTFAGNSKGEPRLPLKPQEKVTIDLLFNWPAGADASEMPKIQFTTGKWWSSQEN